MPQTNSYSLFSEQTKILNYKVKMSLLYKMHWYKDTNKYFYTFTI